MRLYLVPKATAGERWQRTQADAVAEAKAVGTGGFVPRDVPTDQRGLLDFLNGVEKSLANTPAGDLGPSYTEGVIAGLKDRKPEEPTGVPSGPLTLIAVEDFIQNCTAAQLGTIADNVCWRIKELSKGTQARSSSND